MTVALPGRSKVHQSGHRSACKVIIDCASSATIILKLQKKKELQDEKEFCESKSPLVYICAYHATWPDVPAESVFISQPLGSHLAAGQNRIMAQEI